MYIIIIMRRRRMVVMVVVGQCKENAECTSEEGGLCQCNKGWVVVVVVVVMVMI